MKKTAASGIGAIAATRAASSSTGSFESGPNVWKPASSRICAAARSAISARPWPTLQYQSDAVPSRYSLPCESQTRQPSPRTMRTSRSRVAPMLVKPRQKLVMWGLSAFAPRPREPSAGLAAVGVRSTPAAA